MYRDFTYLDIDRIQSIIAQLQEGVLTSVMTGNARELTGKAGIAAGILSSLLPISLEGTASRTSNIQASKILHDYAFNIALEALEDNDLLLKDNELGQDGTFVPDSAFILVHGDISILDYSLLQKITENEEILKMFGMATSTQPQPNREQRRAGAVVQEDPTTVVLKQIKSFISVFMEDGLQVRLKQSDDVLFIGPMSRKFLREEIQSLIFKYGSGPQENWTMLAQISYAPTKNDEGKIAALSNIKMTTPSNASTAMDVLSPMIEILNTLQEAMVSVSYPAIAVTPIAIYRELNSLR